MATSQNKSISSGRGCRFATLVVLVLAAAVAMKAENKNACLDCHSILPDNLGVTEEKFHQDIHFQKGLTCASCHGGDATSDDPEKAMSKKAGFKGHIDRKQIPALCGSCHSDPAFMRTFKPGLRTDQLSQYHTSVHGKRLAAGDTNVAVCTDCHSVHDLRPPSDPRSTVNPVNIPRTCARCHADPEHMKGYRIPTSQYADYSKSVHYNAVMVRGDLSAPTCATCHGNHGAIPPGADSVANVCSTCHVFQAQLFESSPHKEAFAAAGLPGCVTCHSNHKIEHPSDELIGTDSKAVCSGCHSSGDAGAAVAGKIREQLVDLSASIQKAQDMLANAERSGMEVSQPKLELVQARDSLTKARVTLHSLDLAKVQADIKPGMAAAAKDYDAGVEALKERDRRRFGLGASLVAIAIMLVGLRLYLRQLEGA